MTCSVVPYRTVAAPVPNLCHTNNAFACDCIVFTSLGLNLIGIDVMWSEGNACFKFASQLAIMHLRSMCLCRSMITRLAECKQTCMGKQSANEMRFTLAPMHCGKSIHATSIQKFGKYSSRVFSYYEVPTSKELLCSYFCIVPVLDGRKSREAGSLAILPPRCGPMSPGSIPGSGTACPFGFQSKLASLHLKLGFLNNSISGNIVWSYSASANWLLIWHCAMVPWHSLDDYVAHYKNPNLI